MRDVVIVGGGLIGMLTARELHLSGAKVTLLERGQAGQEASWAGGGILSPLYPWRYPDEVIALAAWSQPRYAELCRILWQESGINPQWIRSGLLVLEGEERREAQEWAQRWEVALEVLDKAGLRQWEPALGEEVGPWALGLPEVAQVRNPRLMRALRRSLDVRGVDIREGIEATRLLIRNQTVTGVVTRDGSVSADRVVVAGGAWSGQILAGSSVCLRVEPVRGQMILFRGGEKLLTRIVMQQGHYLIPRRDGHVLAGSTVEYVGFDKSITEAALQELQEAAFRLIPALRSLPVVHQWAGLRPGSPQGIPFIGEHLALKGLYINAGHFRNGVVTGPASARLLADILLGRTPILDPAPYTF